MNGKVISNTQPLIERPFLALFSADHVDSANVSAYVTETVNRALLNEHIVILGKDRSFPHGSVEMACDNATLIPIGEEWPTTAIIDQHLSIYS